MAWETNVTYNFSSATGWTADPIGYGASNITISGGQATGGNGDYESYHTTQFGTGGNFEAFMTCVTVPATGGYNILYAFQAIGATYDGYRVTLIKNAGTDTLRLDRDDDGARTTLVNGSQEVSNGNKIGMRRYNNTLTLGYYNGSAWSVIGTASDSNYNGPYYPGLYLWSNSGSNTVVDDLAVGIIPAPPGNVAITPAGGQATLTWDTVSGATGYKVLRGTSTGTYGTEIDAGNVLTYTNTGLTNGTQYFYTVRAYNSTNTHSDNSSEVSTTPRASFVFANALARGGFGGLVVR